MKISLQEVIEQANRTRSERAELMPTEKDAMLVVWAGIQRLRDLGWKDAIYCPKENGHRSLFWEAGCVGSAPGYYHGEWPNGTWFMEDAGDLWPSRPTLYRPLDLYPTIKESPA